MWTGYKQFTTKHMFPYPKDLFPNFLSHIWNGEISRTFTACSVVHCAICMVIACTMNVFSLLIYLETTASMSHLTCHGILPHAWSFLVCSMKLKHCLIYNSFWYVASLWILSCDQSAGSEQEELVQLTLILTQQLKYTCPKVILMEVSSLKICF